MFRELQPEDIKDTFIAISQGEFIYDLLIEKKAKNIIEFGTSFGISTLYLGAVAKVTNSKVITTELLPNKCKVAAENFTKAALTDYIDNTSFRSTKPFLEYIHSDPTKYKTVGIQDNKEGSMLSEFIGKGVIRSTTN